MARRRSRSRRSSGLRLGRILRPGSAVMGRPLGGGKSDGASGTTVDTEAIVAEVLSQVGESAVTSVDGQIGDVSLSAVYQPKSSTLTSLSSASANGVSLAQAADYAAMRSLLGLVIGTDVQAYTALLAAWSLLDPNDYYTSAQVDTALGNYKTSADLASTVTGKGASLIGVEDAGSYFSGTTVEAVLQYVGQVLAFLDSAVVLVGDWDASSGTFPGSGSAQRGWSYIVTVGGTVDGVEFTAGDRVVAVADNASTTTYAANWLKLDYTDRVSSVAGKVGAVALDADDIDDTSTTNKFTTAADISKLAGIEANATADQTDAEIETAYNNRVAKVSAPEIAAGTETAVRRYSPADIVGLIDAHATAGAGDVVGPSSSVDGEIALFDDTTGKLLKRASTTGLLKAASGVISAATADTDYVTPSGRRVAGDVFMSFDSSPPSGCVELDGATIVGGAASYPIVASRYSWMVVSGDLVLPDFRGRFPRGWAHGSSTDPDRASRTARAGDGATGDSPGTYQNDEVKSHGHIVDTYQSGALGAGGRPQTGTSGSTSTVATANYGGNETRGKNIAVMFCMKMG